MAGTGIQVLLVTANVGSIFEDPSVMLKIWTEEFLQTVARLDPKFIAIHCQEVGGKNYERSMKHVEYFVRLLMTSEELRLFDKVRVYLDEDFSSAEHFTALGNLYFVHETVSDALIWDFATMNFVSASGKEVHSGNIEAVTTKEKAKFPQDFFPECKWSRKGFLRTRWSLNGTVFDLINIHLFHDASNFLAMEAFPSVYCKNRRRALEHTLERFHNDGYDSAPFFVFGDFNFRTDTRGVVAKLSDGLNQVRVQSSKADQTRMQYHDEDSKVILSVGKKEFSHSQHQNIFTGDDGIWLKDFDRELESFSGSLFEFPITFPPSYPFEEDENGAKCYMKTRCPAWCDRVLLANTATSLVNNLSDHSCVEYGIMGSNTCMGDHKPVYLKLELVTNAGTVCCCPATRGATLFCLNGLSRCPVLDTLSLPRLASYAHEPYTPESMDTPSPVPSPTPGDLRELHKSFNDCVTGRLCQQTEDVQGDQGSLTRRNGEADWTHCQSSDHTDVHSALDDNYSDYNANTRLDTTSMLCDNIKPLLQSPMVLVTQFAQMNSDSPSLERYLNKSLEAECMDLPPNVRGKTVKTEVPPRRVPIDCDKRAEEKMSRNINNRVSLQESVAESGKAKARKSPKTFVKCTQSQSAVEMKVSSLDKMVEPDESECGMRTSRCFSDASWLRRADQTPGRVRLLSGCDSLTRLQSHHSSSDEDWFEEVHETETFRSDVNVNKTDGNIPDVCALLYVGLSDDESTDGTSRPTCADNKYENASSPTDTTNKCENASSPTDTTNKCENASSPTDTTKCENASSSTDTTNKCENASSPTDTTNKCENASSPTDTTNKCANASIPTETTNKCENASIPTETTNKCENASSSTDTTNKCEYANIQTDTTNKCEYANIPTYATNNCEHHASSLTDASNKCEYTVSLTDTPKCDNSSSPSDTTNKCGYASSATDDLNNCDYHASSQTDALRGDHEISLTDSPRARSPPKCEDTSTASLMAYFKEQSIALSEESPLTGTHDPVEEDKEKPGPKCVTCCTIL